MGARPCARPGRDARRADGRVSAKGCGDPLSQRGVPEGVDLTPGRGGDLVALELADVGGGAEEEPEVDVLVVRLALGAARGDGVNVDVNGVPVCSNCPAADRPPSATLGLRALPIGLHTHSNRIMNSLWTLNEAVAGWQTVPQVREFRQEMDQIPTATV